MVWVITVAVLRREDNVPPWCLIKNINESPDGEGCDLHISYESSFRPVVCGSTFSQSLLCVSAVGWGPGRRVHCNIFMAACNKAITCNTIDNLVGSQRIDLFTFYICSSLMKELRCDIACLEPYGRALTDILLLSRVHHLSSNVFPGSCTKKSPLIYCH